jgi:hypothetical protein
MHFQATGYWGLRGRQVKPRRSAKKQCRNLNSKRKEKHEDQEYQRNIPDHVRLRFVAETLGEVQRPNGHILSCRGMFEEGLGWCSRPESKRFRRQMVHLPTLQRSQPKYGRAGSFRFLQTRFGEQEGNVREVNRNWKNNLLEATS